MSMVFRCTEEKCPYNYHIPCEIPMEDKRMDTCGNMKPFDNDKEFFLLIVGGRAFSDYQMLREKTDKLIENKRDKHIVVVSGGAKGADSLAEKYAHENKFDLVVIPADWDTYGKAAGYRRNDKMHEYIASKKDRGVIAFWDGKSKGTSHSIELSKKYNNPLRIVRY